MTFATYPKIKHLGDNEIKDIFADPNDIITIQEKVDGANFRFMVNDGRIIFGSRTQSIGDSEQEIGGNWRRCVEHIKAKYEANPHRFVTGYIFYGECMVGHTLRYDFANTPPFLGFDIFNIERNQFEDEGDVISIYARLDLEVVPHFSTMKAINAVDYIGEDKVPKSMYGPFQAEGLVFKNYSKQMFGKFVRAEFKERNREAFGGGKKEARQLETQDDLLIATYCTNARIDKQIFKLIDEGTPLGMPMMQQIPRRVWQDIIEEEWKEILESNWVLDLANIKKRLLTRRCLVVLQQMMTNNALNEPKYQIDEILEASITPDGTGITATIKEIK